ncbi:MAG TPA: TIGR03667 family PPOX class F420-dependent oxidoreductase [Candidatus Dormibacteraeota bacterium]|nr:TIGR03667 family PPOX class F420-dependent oxidoreductase [Candidatus Dormibacteraeota bacterium]
MDRHVQSRLKKELVVWLVTASKEARPQAVPVWFLWADDSFLIYSAPGIKERHVRENPHVELHLNSDEAGDDLVRATGTAKIVAGEKPAHQVPEYLRKYGDQIKGFGWTPEEFSRRYPHPIRVSRLKFH